MSDLTAEEQANVRAGLRFLRTRCGGWEVVARAFHIGPSTLANMVCGQQRPASASLAVRTARLAGVPVDDVLSGKYPQPGACAYCGHRQPDSTTIQGDCGNLRNSYPGL